jgi:hypothetical protein
MYDKNAINTIDQSKEQVKQFKINTFIDYQPESVFRPVDGVLSLIAQLNDYKALSDRVLELSEIDLMDAITLAMEELGLGSLNGMFNSYSGLIAEIINMLADLATVYGGELLRRLEILGLVENSCSNRQRLFPYTHRVLAPLYLGKLFSMLNCYGMTNTVDMIVDMLDPIKEIVLTPAYTDSTGIYHPEVTAMRRSGSKDRLLAEIIPQLLETNPLEHISRIKEQAFAPVIARHVKNFPSIISRAVAKENLSNRVNPAEDYDNIIELLFITNILHVDNVNITNNISIVDVVINACDSNGLKQLAKMKSMSIIPVIEYHETITETISDEALLQIL